MASQNTWDLVSTTSLLLLRHPVFTVLISLSLVLIRHSLSSPVDSLFQQNGGKKSDCFEESKSPPPPGVWCYHGDPSCVEKTWEGECQEGRLQSPIDLPYLDSIDTVDSYIEHFPFNSYNISNFTLVNNGLTVEILPAAEKLPSFFWPSQQGHYRFHSINFHWGRTSSNGSEHSVAGVRFPMEMHLIHYRTDFVSIDAAMGSKSHNALAILTILFTIGHSPKPTRLMHPIVRALPQVKTHKARIFSKDTFDLTKFFRGTQAYSYYGSLTIPPCSEQVVWLIWGTPVNVSEVDIEAFRRLEGTDGKPNVNNFRSRQKDYEREISLVGVHYTSGKTIIPANSTHQPKD